MLTLRFVQTLQSAKLLTLVCRDLSIDSAGKRSENIDALCDAGNQVEALFSAAIDVVLADGDVASVREILRAIQVLEEANGDAYYVGVCQELLDAPMCGAEFVVVPAESTVRAKLRRSARAV